MVVNIKEWIGVKTAGELVTIGMDRKRCKECQHLVMKWHSKKKQLDANREFCPPLPAINAATSVYKGLWKIHLRDLIDLT